MSYVLYKFEVTTLILKNIKSINCKISIISVHESTLEKKIFIKFKINNLVQLVYPYRIFFSIKFAAILVSPFSVGSQKFPLSDREKHGGGGATTNLEKSSWIPKYAKGAQECLTYSCKTEKAYTYVLCSMI